ncbi:MAG: DNA alkylation repair protein [Candidatus Bathyarchaeota archaeon]|nr:DNA alkylation repair protein [Candidatus Bathyarchaeota archaeon]
MHEIAEAIRSELSHLGTAEGVEKTKRYFREPIQTYGCTSSDAKTVATRFLPLTRKNLDLTLIVAGDLMTGGVMEENWVGSSLIAKHKSRIRPEHFEIFDKWIDSLSNWASIDTFTTDVVVEAVKRDPQLVDRLLQWTQSTNRWRRRASAVTLVRIARRGDMLEEAFAITDKLMEDPDDMVQKGAGWLLKEASKNHPQEVHDYLIRWKPKTTGLVLRYASEKLPQELKVYKSR